MSDSMEEKSLVSNDAIELTEISGTAKSAPKLQVLRKRDKLKITFMWILLVVVCVQWLAIGVISVTYQYALDNLSVTAPKWLAWGISPGPFIGCRAVPPQLYGSYGS